MFGGNENVDKKRVYYEGSDTLYTGVALCYNQDTTDNILGYDKENSEAGSTTAEGYQNEGKFLRVEKPATANLQFLAGYVAEGSNNVTGPKWVDIHVPNGAIFGVRATDSVTIGDKMYVINGDYEVTTDLTAASVHVGYAMETVDRSSTEGIILMKSIVGMIEPAITAGADAPSPNIWDQFDLDRLRKDLSYGFLYEDDYMGPIDVTTADGYIVTQATSGGIVGSLVDQGGVFIADSAGHAGADDGVNVQLPNCMVKPAAGVKIGFEARCKVVDAGDDQYFIGLAGADSTLIAAGILDDTVDKAGFYRIAASTADKISTVVAKTSAEDSTADVANLADDTFVTLGFVIDGITSIKFYVNGALVETGTTAVNLPNSVMALSYVAQCEQTAADAELAIDWVRVAQVGGRA